LDLILTGRAVQAEEALAIGLANRVVAPGESRAAAEQLAAEIARFPWSTVLSDRRSAYDALGLSERDALAQEFQHGQGSLTTALAGAQQFVGGAGRHGSFGEGEAGQSS
jgi:enoyl-CoA hydratase